MLSRLAICLVATLIATLAIPTPQLASAASACTGEVAAVSKRLAQANFPEPSKPGAIVTSPAGVSMPAGTLSEIKTLIAEADAACASGRNDRSLQLAGRARRLLGNTGQ